MNEDLDPYTFSKWIYRVLLYLGITIILILVYDLAYRNTIDNKGLNSLLQVSTFFIFCIFFGLGILRTTDDRYMSEYTDSLDRYIWVYDPSPNPMLGIPIWLCILAMTNLFLFLNGFPYFEGLLTRG